MYVLHGLWRAAQTLFFVYASSAIIFTTNRLFVSPIRSLWVGSATLRSGNFSALYLVPPLSRAAIAETPQPSSTDLSKPVLSWPTGMGNTSLVYLEESTFLSKAFSDSMKPSDIIPFYYRAHLLPDSHDITITTLVTSNRFPVFSRLVERYQGPISAAVHVHTSQNVSSLLSALHSLYTSSPSMLKYVDVHLVMDVHDRQFNTWRNVARLFARTELVMMLDVDFAICTDLRKAIRDSDAVKELVLTDGPGNALVIPAFEFTKKGVSEAALPKDKRELVSMVKSKKIDMFHASWPAGHNSTEYDRFYDAKPGDVYKVTRYQSSYEPYIVFRKDGPPWCDERFVGYGGNKAACLFEMYLSGMDFFVLADHFLVHQNHPYEEAIRKQERKSNRKMYLDFKEETCLQYLKRYHDSGMLSAARGHHLQAECKKVKGVPKTALEA